MASATSASVRESGHALDGCVEVMKENMFPVTQSANGSVAACEAKRREATMRVDVARPFGEAGQHGLRVAELRRAVEQQDRAVGGLRIDNPRGTTDADRRVGLVSGDHPHADPARAQILSLSFFSYCLRGSSAPRRLEASLRSRKCPAEEASARSRRNYLARVPRFYHSLLTCSRFSMAFDASSTFETNSLYSVSSRLRTPMTSVRNPLSAYSLSVSTMVSTF